MKLSVSFATPVRRMNRSPQAALLLATLIVAGCANQAPKTDPASAIRAEMEQATAAKPAVVVPAQISDALQAGDATATATAIPAEARFDLIVNNALAREVFQAMVTDTRYSMLMHPEVTGTLSVTLRGVTVREALEAIRDVYGYDFKLDGRRITVYPPTLQTRIFMVNYLNTQRSGKSEVRVSGGVLAVTPNNAPGQAPTSGQSNAPGQQQQYTSIDSSKLTTTTKTDFWAEIHEALTGIVGNAAGRNVVVSPQSGIIAVRAMPDELRQVDNYLKAARISVERQVMLEAKIVEVQLRDGFQSGVDWSILRGRGAGGTYSGSTLNRLVNPAGGRPGLPGSEKLPLQDGTAFPVPGSGLFGLAFATGSFEGILSFLETQGNTQILSSPRVATLNNQKAVLKVGTDEYFVTGITGGSFTGATANQAAQQTAPTISLTAFFSGIALDVTPQIDQADTVTLHVHPSVSAVNESVKQVDLGVIGTYRLPVAANSTNETDTIVRVTDGNIVAIGGLMQVQKQDARSGLPGSTRIPFFSSLLGNQQQTTTKRELVVLIKPTIIRSNEEWRDRAQDARDRIEELDGARRIISIEGARPAAAAKSK
jgi:MSHA biogenesis protein MshL